MSGTISVTEVVTVLKDSSVLIQNWVEFGQTLGLPTDTMENLKYRRSSMQVYDMFMEIVTTWIGINGREATLQKLETILEEMGATDCAEILLEGTNSLSQIVTASSRKPQFSRRLTLPIRFGVGPLVNGFTGREKELAQLKEIFVTQRRVVVVISGLGGMGKTELIRKFVTQFPPDSVVSWLSGDTVDTLGSSLTQFCTFLHISTTEDNKPIESTQLIKKIVDKLQIGQNTVPWVTVVDNVDEKHEEFAQVTKAILQFPRSLVVVTSRRKDIFPGESKCIQLLGLEEEDGARFVESSLELTNPEIPDSDALELTRRLENFPLALQQAVAYIRQQKLSLFGDTYGIPQYLAEFDKQFEESMGKSMELADYDGVTLTVWDMTIHKIKEMGPQGQMAISILEVLAFVIPDGIQIEFLRELVSHAPISQPNAETYNEALKLLILFSLVRCCKSVISLHRLVQKVTRLRMRKERTSSLNKDEVGISRASVVLNDILLHLDIDSRSKEDMTHVLSIWSHSSEDSTLIKKFSHIPNRMFSRLSDLSMINEEYSFAVTNLNLLQLTLGADHRHALIMEHHMAFALAQKGEYAQALEKYKAVYEREKRIFGEEDISTVRNIAFVLNELKRYPEALEWGQRVLQSHLKVFGENSLEVLFSRYLIAIVLNRQGNYSEAMEFYEQVLQLRQLGERHPDTLITKHHIGCCLFNQSKFEWAQVQLESVLEARLEVLGHEHRDTLATKYHLARTLHRLGKNLEALRMMEQVLDRDTRVLGEDHPHTIQAKIVLAQIKLSLSKPSPVQNNASLLNKLGLTKLFRRWF